MKLNENHVLANSFASQYLPSRQFQYKYICEMQVKSSRRKENIFSCFFLFFVVYFQCQVEEDSRSGFAVRPSSFCFENVVYRQTIC